MLKLTIYDVIIFDCDGVIFDCNKLKIDAMQKTLKGLSKNRRAIEESINYFQQNFGKSRFHHVEIFANNFFGFNPKEAVLFENKVLEAYSENCKALYLQTSLTPRIVDVLKLLAGKKLYIASGSAQEELREVFRKRNLAHFFVDIFGSPATKDENIGRIVIGNSSKSCVMIGDSVSDFESSVRNNINFIFYAPFSNVKSKMLELSKIHGFPILNDFLEVLPNE